MEFEIEPIENPAIYVVTESLEDPTKIDYDILGFHKVRTFLQGRLTEIAYYKHYDPLTNEYAMLAVKEYNTYTDVNTYLYSRFKHIDWYLTDGTIGVSKQTMKFFNRAEAMKEGVVRRNNIIDNLKALGTSIIGEMYAVDLLLTCKVEIEYYLQGYVAPLISTIQALQKPYLDAFLPESEITIRQGILSQLIYEEGE